MKVQKPKMKENESLQGQNKGNEGPQSQIEMKAQKAKIEGNEGP